MESKDIQIAETIKAYITKHWPHYGKYVHIDKKQTENGDIVFTYTREKESHDEKYVWNVDCYVAIDIHDKHGTWHYWEDAEYTEYGRTWIDSVNEDSGKITDHAVNKDFDYKAIGTERWLEQVSSIIMEVLRLY
jgi:hypothetical protein